MERFRIRILVLVGVAVLAVSGFLPWLTADYGSGWVVKASIPDLLRGSGFQLSDASDFSLLFYVCSLIVALIALFKSRYAALAGVFALIAGILFFDNPVIFAGFTASSGNAMIGLFAKSVGIGIGPISAMIAGSILLATSILRKLWSRVEEEPTLTV